MSVPVFSSSSLGVFCRLPVLIRVSLAQFKKIQYIHMIGELTKGSCSMFGAWGDAVNQTNSKLMQLRALDWDVDGPFRVSACVDGVVFYVMSCAPSLLWLLMFFILLHDDRTFLRSRCTTPLHRMDMRLRTLDGQDGLDPSLVCASI